MNALTAMVFLAIAGFVVLAIIGWIRDSGSSTAEATDRSAGRPAVTRVLEVY